MEQFTCVQSGFCCCGRYSLPCDGLRRDGRCVLLRAFRDVKPELVHGDALEV